MTKHLHSSVVSQIWLNYYNQTLYRQGVITEAAYRQMLLRIQNTSETMYSDTANINEARKA